ncbi:MAG: bacteriochlorophyll 4-vinyl reductase [Chromatocurvus sp.]
MSSWTKRTRMSRFGPEGRPATAAGIGATDARIGPNSVLQLAQVLDAHVGQAARQALMVEAGLMALPPDSGLMPEGPAARLHQALRLRYPAEAAALLAREAGGRTGDYILAHRIPLPAQRLLRVLPRFLATRLLAGAIGKHAWTFAGSGDFRVARGRPLTFELYDNPVVRGEHARQPLCHWHAAVFQRLFSTLVSPDIRCVEVECCAMGSSACRFTLC